MGDLLYRAIVHDNSKYSSAECDAYGEVFAELQQAAYGSEAYQAALQTIQPTIMHHYQVNDHHSEHGADGIAAMNLIQILEMVCDWIAASERNHHDILTSLQINRARFGIDDQLFALIRHTVDYLVSTTPTS